MGKKQPNETKNKLYLPMREEEAMIAGGLAEGLLSSPSSSDPI